MTYDVNLPRDHQPVYPNRCVRCHCDPQGNSIVLWTHMVGWWTFLLLFFGWPVSTTVPACRSCKLQIRVQRLGLWIFMLLLSFIFMWFVWPMVDDFVPKVAGKWVAVGMIMICALPFFIWQLIVPPCFDFTAYQQSIDYEFKDHDYAVEFANLNRHADWVKVDG
ncbi:MAG: hypothetical protein ACK449_18465 [Planctomycetota bacterium]|jgi:hypothetical protein